MQPRSAKIGQKLGGGILLCLLAFEVGLRLHYPALPSRSSSPAEPPGYTSCIPKAGAPSPESAWTKTFNPDSDPLFHIVISGDSVALGSGVLPQQTFSWLLGQKLTEETQLGVHVTNLSINGGGACDTVGRLLTHLAHQPADLVLAAFFADDLQDFTAVSHQGQLHIDPQKIEGLPAKPLITHSYSANWIWWQALRQSHSAEQLPFEVETVEVKRGLNALREQTTRQGVSTVLTLIAPTGAPLCPGLRPDSRPVEECVQLEKGGEILRGLLNGFDDDFVDLRTLWSASTSPIQAKEIEAMEETQRLPIHPNEAGHQAIATALWPAVSTHIPKANSPHQVPTLHKLQP